MSNNYTYIGFPAALAVISILSFVYIGLEIKRKRIEIKDIAFWFFMNIIFSLMVIYVLILDIVQVAMNVKLLNIFNWIAQNAFAFSFKGQEWIILLILGFISFILMIAMLNTVKVQKLNNRIDELNKEVAILSGKINRTANIDSPFNITDEKSLKESRQMLKNKIKLAKIEKKAKEKLKLITKTQQIPIEKKK